jgi:hypothetical protein
MEGFAGGSMKSPEQLDQVMRPTADSSWIVLEEGYDSLLERSRAAHAEQAVTDCEARGRYTVAVGG